MPEPSICKSLGLHALLGKIGDERNFSILDLGQACGANVEFWSQFQCRLQIEDFYRRYKAASEAAPDDGKDEIISRLLPYAEGTSFDVILAWDLFNYFCLEEVAALIRRVTACCRRGSLMFGLISSQPQIPAEPNRYRIVDHESMVYESFSQSTRPCPRHQPRDIALLLSRFQVSSSFLLRHGIQEYVWEFKSRT